jgi:hypothetical protein
VPAGTHAREYGLGYPKGSHRVQVEQLCELVRRRGLDRGVEDHPRVRDEDVDLASVPDRGRDARRIGNVERQPLIDVEVGE